MAAWNPTRRRTAMGLGAFALAVTAAMGSPLPAMGESCTATPERASCVDIPGAGSTAIGGGTRRAGGYAYTGPGLAQSAAVAGGGTIAGTNYQGPTLTLVSESSGPDTRGEAVAGPLGQGANGEAQQTRASSASPSDGTGIPRSSATATTIGGGPASSAATGDGQPDEASTATSRVVSAAGAAATSAVRGSTARATSSGDAALASAMAANDSKATSTASGASSAAAAAASTDSTATSTAKGTNSVAGSAASKGSTAKATAAGDNSFARATAIDHDRSVAWAGKNATATASSAQNGAPASVSCGGGNAYAANQNGRTFCVSGKYYSFTYAPNKVDLKLDLPTTPPKKTSSSTVQKTSSSKNASSSTKDSSSESKDSAGSKDSSSGSKDSGSGSTKTATLTEKD